MCNYSTTSLVDGRCSRAIVDGLAPLLLKKLLLRSTLQPLVLLLGQFFDEFLQLKQWWIFFLWGKFGGIPTGLSTMEVGSR